MLVIFRLHSMWRLGLENSNQCFITPGSGSLHAQIFWIFSISNGAYSGQGRQTWFIWMETSRRSRSSKRFQICTILSEPYKPQGCVLVTHSFTRTHTHTRTGLPLIYFDNISLLFIKHTPSNTSGGVVLIQLCECTYLLNFDKLCWCHVHFIFAVDK